MASSWLLEPRMALYDLFGCTPPNGGVQPGTIPDNLLMGGFGYGGMHHSHVKSHGSMQPPFAHGLGARRQLNWWAVFLAVMVPVALFTGTFCAMSFELGYSHPQSALLVVLSAFFFTLLVAAFSVQAKRTEMRGGERTWHSFIFSTCLLACFLGSCLGYINLSTNATRYYDYISLRKAVDVDPGQLQGQSLLDAGEVDFKMGTHIDRSLHSLWHKGKTWCVAPIVSKDGAKMASYDFWAVGMDCCSAATGDFSCGVVYTSWASGSEPPAGLRVMDTSEIRGYELALEQATAAHKIQSQRPIFLYMQKTPYLAIKEYFNDAKTFAIVSCSGFFLIQLLLVYNQCYSFGKDSPSGYMDLDKTSKMHFHH